MDAKFNEELLFEDRMIKTIIYDKVTIETRYKMQINYRY